MNLTQCNFSAALKNIAQILQLHKAAPTIFNKFLSVIHILIALYAQAVGYPYYSVLHLERAMQVIKRKPRYYLFSNSFFSKL